MVLYQWRDTETDIETATDIQKTAQVSLPTAKILANRGLDAKTSGEFLSPALNKLIDPYLLSGTEKAAARLWQAVCNDEKILIHGDYDTDGITAAVLISQVLTDNGLSTEIFLPHRIEDGYGLTAESIEKAGRTAFSILLTVDCGITSFDAIATARQKGIDVIVTDHHEPGESLPAAFTVINPKLPGTPLPMKELAGVGVAFKLCHAFLKYGREHQLGGFETDLRDYLDLVAIGTVADIVPLRGENRCLVRHGLPVLSHQKRPGIRALCECAELHGDQLNTKDIAFYLAPRLNAPGRMGHADLSIALLTATSMADASRIARQINAANLWRREQENEVLAMAESQLATSGFNLNCASIVVHGDNWHQGVLGIVAARLCRTHHRPTAVLTRDQNGSFCGSVRSVPGLNLISILQTLQHLLLRFGGHNMAAGLSVEEDKLTEFKDRFELQIKQATKSQVYQPQLELDGTVRLRDLDERFFSEYKMLAPFGHSNPEPLFVCRQASPGWTCKAGREHCRGIIFDQSNCKMGFIAFRRLPGEFPEPPWDVAIRPQLNIFNGECKPQVEILDVRPARS